jgi:hypothetical protein
LSRYASRKICFCDDIEARGTFYRTASRSMGQCAPIVTGSDDDNVGQFDLKECFPCP